jgi:hypothetical protein
MTDFLKARLQHVFDVTVWFGKDRTVFGPLPGGASQGYTPPLRGVISGPKLNGAVVPHSGADYATVRSDGVIELNAHYLLKADDGTLIYIQNQGYLVRAPEGKGKPNDQGVPQPLYFKFTPKFRVPEGPHDWLARTVIVGSGERRSDPDHSIFRYYAVK